MSFVTSENEICAAASRLHLSIVRLARDTFGDDCEPFGGRGQRVAWELLAFEFSMDKLPFDEEELLRMKGYWLGHGFNLDESVPSGVVEFRRKQERIGRITSLAIPCGYED